MRVFGHEHVLGQEIWRRCVGGRNWCRDRVKLWWWRRWIREIVVVEEVDSQGTG